ncbi:hypothetical protein L3Y34_014168 [Caenorhabditis briggsae]|uniref:Uncharacterized protein n=1 Tax=Caenorhabditis briggsae TaxID=6238 RepID=A0AAE9DQ53_CAEBR|nr:hypothetical protein L3Y34_014168 [Caenorhabditis briggsae]
MMGTDCLGDPADMLTMCNKGTVTGQDAKTVVITAFENRFFKFWKKNPSEAVLDELLKSPRKNINIVPIKIKSTFEAVDEKIPEIGKCSPEFILHLAAHSTPKIIYLEKMAFSNGYCNPLESTVDFKYLLDELDEKCEQLKIKKSENMERSIDNYLYSLTLRESSQKTLLIRIPPFDDEYTKEAITSVIREVMRALTRD